MAKPHRDPLVQAFERLVAARPASPLVVAPGRRATAAGVDAQARAAARALNADPPAPGEPVALLAANGPAFLAGLVALLRAGAAPLLLDARAPEPERARVACELGAPRLLACARPWPAGPSDWHVGRPIGVPAVNGSAPGKRGAGAGAVIKLTSGSVIELASGSVIELTSGSVIELTSGVVIKLTSGSVIKLTSGSTGTPRGIVTPVEALLADDDALSATMGLGDRDRLLAAIPFSHSYGLSSLVVPALARGRMLVLPGEDGPFGPLAAAAAAGATAFPTVPAYLAALLRLEEPPPLPPSLRLVLTAGAPLPAETSAGFRARYGRPVHVFYGASECGGICYDREGGAAERGTVGAPVEGVRIDLEPAEPAGSAGSAGEAVGEGPPAGGPGGEAGRVAVRSPAVAAGYLPRPGPALAGGRFLTGDLAVWRGGELALVGRLDDVINVRGKKVNPREVECVLRGLAAVEDVAVFAAPAGSGAACEATVRAVIACAAGALTRETVLSWCRDRLADHKRPRSVVLVEHLPRTERGKLDRAALTRLAAAETRG
jgi:long-chain acyl-CoA synthetase